MYATNELANALFRSVRAGVVIVDADTKRIIDINPVASVMIGVDREEAVGKSCKFYLCAENCDGCPVMTANLNDGIEEVEDKEIVLSREDGSVVYALLTINSVILNGSRVFINSLIDISKQKAAEYKIKGHWDDAGRLLSDNIRKIKTGAI